MLDLQKNAVRGFADNAGLGQIGVVDKVNEVGEADVVDEVNHLFLHVCDARLHQFHFVLKWEISI